MWPSKILNVTLLFLQSQISVYYLYIPSCILFFSLTTYFSYEYKLVCFIFFDDCTVLHCLTLIKFMYQFLIQCIFFYFKNVVVVNIHNYVWSFMSLAVYISQAGFPGLKGKCSQNFGRSYRALYESAVYVSPNMTSALLFCKSRQGLRLSLSHTGCMLWPRGLPVKSYLMIHDFSIDQLFVVQSCVALLFYMHLLESNLIR